MHRSGTSALTGLLRALGLWAGEMDDFPPGDAHNQAGYWEHLGVWAVNEAILQTLGASWCDVADLDLSRLTDAERTPLQQHARGIVRELDAHGSWVIKDPRLCLLFPFWREVLERPFCILVYRDPLSTARSLARRDGFPLSFGIALWEKYNREALAATRGLPRALVSYRELLADPAASVRRLREKMPEIASLRQPGAEEIRTRLSPELAHHAPDPESERQYLTPPQRALLDSLADGSALGLDPIPPLSSGAQDLLATCGVSERLAAETRRADQLERTMAELDALLSSFLDSPSWKIGRALTAVPRSLLGHKDLTAAERRDRLLAGLRIGRPRRSPPRG